MYCEQCGKWNEDGKKTCFSCGSPLKIEPKEKEETGKPTAGEKNTGKIKAVAENGTAKKTTAKKSTKKKTSAKKKTESIERKTRSSHSDLEAMEKELRQLNQKGRPVMAFLLACLVLVIILVVLVDQIPKRYGAKQDAEAFETALLSGQWDKAYASLYMPEESSPFLSEESFIELMNRSGASGFRNLELEEISSEEDQKVFTAVYDTADGTRKTDYLTLCPTGNKRMVFLKEWKVDPVTLCVSDVTITVPEDAELTLNGLRPEGEPVMHPEAYTAEYTIPKMFAGSWTVELQAEHRAPYYEEIEVSAADKAFSFEGIEMDPDQALMDSLIQQFGQVYQAILEASVNREDFSVVESYFTSQAVQEGRARTLYENACSQAYDPERGTGIIRYELKDTTGLPMPIVKSGYAVAGDVVMEIHSTMSYTYIKDGMENSDSKASVGLLCFHQEDGSWKIQSFS